MPLLQDSVFALVASGKRIVRDLEASGAIALWAPLEGGNEGRYIRRIRAAGYTALHITARGLGDPDTFLSGVHGVRPPHLGKKEIRRYFVPPIVQTQLDALPARSKGLVIWVIEGYILSRQELDVLATLPQVEPRVKVVVEMGGARACRWEPLRAMLRDAG